MKNKLSLAIAFGVATMCVSSTSFAEKTFTIGGDFEYNLTGESKDIGGSDSSHLNGGGRGKLNATAMVTNSAGYFAKGVVQPTIAVDGGGFGSDDNFFQFGRTNAWDIQIGRFEGVNLFPVGKDTVLNKVDGDFGYNGGAYRGRANDHAALHIGSGTGFGAELGIVFGKDGAAKSTAIRPVITYNTGSMKFHAGMESGQNDNQGFGVGVNANLGGGSLGIAYADGEIGGLDENSLTLNYTKGNWGVGYVRDERDGVNDSQDSIFGAYTMPLLGLSGASVTFAASHSSLGDDSVNALRTRFNYSF